jgi:hypothetical protein
VRRRYRKVQRRHFLSRPRVDARAQLHQRVRAQLHQRLPRVRRLPSAVSYVHLLTRVATLAQTAGRAGETAAMSYRQMQWDHGVQVVYVDIPQLKTKKVKKVAFFVGANMEICWLVDFADHLCLELRMEKYDEDKGAFLFSELMDVRCPGKVLGNYIKTLVEALPEVLTKSCAAAGFRAGALQLLHQYMPETFACIVSGHSTYSEAFQQYLDADLAMCIPGGIVLAGWPELPWGQNGAGPKPATLDAIKDLPLPSGVEFENMAAMLDTFADTLYTLKDPEYCPPQLVRGGALRQLVLAALATQVMYYTERVKTQGMSDVLSRMREVVQHLNLAPTLLDAHELLGRWSGMVKDRFDKDNLHMTSRAKDTGYRPVVDQMRKLTQEATELKQEVTELKQEVRETRAEVTETRVQLNAVVAQLTTVLTQLSKTQAQLDAQLSAAHGAPGGSSAGGSPATASEQLHTTSAGVASPATASEQLQTTSAGVASPAAASAQPPAEPAAASATGAGTRSMPPDVTHRRPLRARVPRQCWGNVGAGSD